MHVIINIHVIPLLSAKILKVVVDSLSRVEVCLRSCAHICIVNILICPVCRHLTDIVVGSIVMEPVSTIGFMNVASTLILSVSIELERVDSSSYPVLSFKDKMVLSLLVKKH